MEEKKKRPITAAQRAAVARYESKNYDKTLIRLPAGRLDAVRAAAARAGASLNNYIVGAIDARLAIDSAPGASPAEDRAGAPAGES